MEFRIATLVTEELHQLGYSLALGRKVVNKSSRMGSSDEFTLQREFEHARRQGTLAQWIAAFEGGFTGIVATLDTGHPGSATAFRVDMDALSLSERQDVSHHPYRDGLASYNVGVIRACGYDGHTAVGLGLAHTLKQFGSGLHGVIKLIFQPAKGGTRGARAMIDAGVVDGVDYLTAIHIGADVSAGTVMYGSDNFITTTKFDAHFTGTTARAGAKPEDGHNTLLAAAQATLALHAIAPHSEGASRMNVGIMQAGSGCNIVPASALLKVETRGVSDIVNQYILDRAQQVIQGAATMYGIGVETRLMGAATASSPSSRWVA